MNLKSVAGWAVVVFGVYYLFTDPVGAAHFMQHVLATLKGAGAHLSVFASHL